MACPRGFEPLTSWFVVDFLLSKSYNGSDAQGVAKLREERLAKKVSQPEIMPVLLAVSNLLIEAFKVEKYCIFRAYEWRDK